MNKSEYNILIVEDETIAIQYLKLILTNLGYTNIYEARSTEEAIKTVKNKNIDLTFMDININGAQDGITCAHLINKQYSIPIIFTSAYNDSQTFIDASDTNIFGYLVKPFEMHDVEATLIVALKRIKNDSNKNINLNMKDDILIKLGEKQILNISKNSFYINNQYIELTKKELDILSILAKNLNHNTTIETLKEKVWDNKNISNSTIRDTISRLRKKAPNLNIQSISGIGYVLKVAR